MVQRHKVVNILPDIVGMPVAAVLELVLVQGLLQGLLLAHCCCLHLSKRDQQHGPQQIQLLHHLLWQPSEPSGRDLGMELQQLEEGQQLEVVVVEEQLEGEVVVEQLAEGDEEQILHDVAS